MKNSAPVLNGLNLVVRDMDATVAFYRRLGLEIPDATVWRTESGAHHATMSMSNGLNLDLDSERFVNHYDAGWNATDSNRAIVGFSLSTREEVDAHYAELVGAGYTGLQEPFDAFWGARYAVVEDPDGNHVGLMSPIDPARKNAPPSV